MDKTKLGAVYVYGQGGLALPKRVRQPNKVMLRRLQQLMEEQRLNAHTLAHLAGLNPSAVYDLLSGRSQAPAYDTINSLSKVLKVDGAYLTGLSSHRIITKKTAEEISLPIIGFAETGTWRIMPIDDAVKPAFPLRVVHTRVHPHYLDTPHFAIEVADNSMDASRPLPLVRGMIACAIDLVVLRKPIESGRLYAVRITREDGENPQHQLLIRRVMIDSEGYELVAETSQPSSYPLQRFAGLPSSDPQDTVTIIGLIYRLQYDLD